MQKNEKNVGFFFTSVETQKPIKSKKPINETMQRICLVEDCNKPVHARERCHLHYDTFRRTVGTGKLCTKEECDKPAIAKNLCSNHYAQYRTALKKKSKAS